MLDPLKTKDLFWNSVQVLLILYQDDLVDGPSVVSGTQAETGELKLKKTGRNRVILLIWTDTDICGDPGLGYATN